jgi:hypothetical protein
LFYIGEKDVMVGRLHNGQLVIYIAVWKIRVVKGLVVEILVIERVLHFFTFAINDYIRKMDIYLLIILALGLWEGLIRIFPLRFIIVCRIVGAGFDRISNFG